MTRLVKLLPALALAAWAASPSTAHAYRFMCNSIDAYGNVAQGDGCACNLSNAERWSNAFINWKVSSAAPSFLGSAGWNSVVNTSVAAWDVSCTNFSMTNGGWLSGQPDFGTNSAQQTLWWISDTTTYQRVVGGDVAGTLGVTLAPYYIIGNCTGRDAADADIIMNNAGGAQWTTSMGGCSGNCVSVAATLIHEIGHALGLGHPCTYPENCGNGGAIMAAIAGYRQDLNNILQDDQDGICALYPGSNRGLGTACNGNGDCDSNLCITDSGTKYCSQTCGSCPTGYTCQGGQCKRAIPAVGDVCTGTCVQGALCIDEGNGTRRCYKQCNPGANPTGCVAGTERCYDLSEDHTTGVCVPEGSQQPGESCTTATCRSGSTCYITGESNACTRDDQCNSAAGEMCYTEGGYNKCITAHCLQDCTGNTQCPSGQRCGISQGETTGACVGNRPENSVCGDGGLLTGCGQDLICLCANQACDYGTCMRDCTANRNSCLNGYRCEVLSDNQTYICVMVMTEGQGCNNAVCDTGLICVVDAPNNGAHCYRDCSQAQCPQGRYCNTYNQGTPNQFAICETEPASSSSSSSGGSTSSSSSSGGTSTSSSSSSGGTTTSSSGGTTTSSSGGSSGNPNGQPFGGACSVGGDCQSGYCTSTSTGSRICTSPCDPRQGHYDCGHGAVLEGCVENDAGNLAAGGQCMPNGQRGSQGVGSTCTTRHDCADGICYDGLCSTWCGDGGSCPNDYTCETGYTTRGVCKPSSGGNAPAPACACVSSDQPPRTPGVLVAVMALFGLLAARRRRA
jgi:MYXO-CTERM domain-containing protein